MKPPPQLFSVLSSTKMVHGFNRNQYNAELSYSYLHLRGRQLHNWGRVIGHQDPVGVLWPLRSCPLLATVSFPNAPGGCSEGQRGCTWPPWPSERLGKSINCHCQVVQLPWPSEHSAPDLAGAQIRGHSEDVGTGRWAPGAGGRHVGWKDVGTGRGRRKAVTWSPGSCQCLGQQELQFPYLSQH